MLEHKYHLIKENIQLTFPRKKRRKIENPVGEQHPIWAQSAPQLAEVETLQELTASSA
jgi:hypothetical protein